MNSIQISPHRFLAPASRKEAFRPCFIVGCERSGTTLLAVLLDRHSQVAVTPETHFFTVVPKRHRDRQLTHEFLLDRLFAWKRTEDLRLNRERLARRFACERPTYRALFQSVLEEYAASQGKAIVGEKTPSHLLQVPLIFRWYPAARVVGIVRDGRDVALSLMNMPWVNERRLRPLCWRWVRRWRLAQRYRKRYPEQFFMLRFEDLLTNPIEALEQVDAFLGLDFEPDQLDTSASSRVVPQWEQPWKGDATQQLDASRIGTWKTKADDHQKLAMNTLMGRDLRRAGYGDTSGPTCSMTTKAFNAVANLPFHSGLFQLWQELVVRHLPSERARRRQVRAELQRSSTAANSENSAAG